MTVFLRKKCQKMSNLAKKNDKNDVFTSNFINQKH